METLPSTIQEAELQPEPPQVPGDRRRQAQGQPAPGNSGLRPAGPGGRVPQHGERSAEAGAGQQGLRPLPPQPGLDWRRGRRSPRQHHQQAPQ